MTDNKETRLPSQKDCKRATEERQGKQSVVRKILEKRKRNCKTGYNSR